MNLTFKNETFRDDYTFKNSPEAVASRPPPGGAAGYAIRQAKRGARERSPCPYR
jgi:hypothetical protein